MTFKIGEITLPVDPQQAVHRSRKNIKEIGLLLRLPFLLSLGPRVPVLKLKGYLGSTGKTAAQIQDDYLLPLDAYVISPACYPRILGDDGMVAKGWAGIGWGSGSLLAATVSDDTTQKVFGIDSLKAIVNAAGTYSRSGAQFTWTEDQDWSKNDFFSIQLYGLNSGSFVVEFYDNSVTEEESWTDDWSGWARKHFPLSQITSCNLEKIRRIRVGRTTTGTTWFDRIMVGVGHYVDGPGTRYDGFYLIREFKWKEFYKVINAFPYDMELWKEDDYY